jgi:hypothetical protein
MLGPHLTGPEELCGLVDPPLHQLFHHVPLVYIHRDQRLQGLPESRDYVISASRVFLKNRVSVGNI